MEEDMVIGGEEENKGPFTENNVDEDSVEWDETTAAEYIEAAGVTFERLMAIDDLQLTQMTELERSYIKKTKKWCIRIIHHYIKDIYDDLVSEDKPTEE